MSGLSARGGGYYALSGELTFATVPGLWRPGEDKAFAGDSAVCLDLSGITRVDSAGIALLIELTRAVRRANAVLRLEQAPPQLMAIAELSGLDKVLPFAAPAGKSAGNQAGN